MIKNMSVYYQADRVVCNREVCQSWPKKKLKIKPVRSLNVKNLPPTACGDTIAIKTNKTSNWACRNAQTSEGCRSLGSSRYLGSLAYNNSCSTLHSDIATVKLTALKLTGVAIAFTDSRKRVPRERGEDRWPRGRVGSSHKSGKSESRNDFELHIGRFVLYTEHWGMFEWR